MLPLDTTELISLIVLTLLRLGVPVLLLVLLSAMARRIQTLQP
jgi:hypothetical protein